MENVTEHHTYRVYNGESFDNDFSFKVCENKLKLLFNGGTTVSKADFLDIYVRRNSYLVVVLLVLLSII